MTTNPLCRRFNDEPMRCGRFVEPATSALSHSFGHFLKTVVLFSSFASICHAADWDGVPVPADPGANRSWRLLDVSDDFSYDAQPLDKPEPFTRRWNEGFVNPWKGPGLTDWTTGHAYVTAGHLGIAASRKEGTDQVRLGSIVSKEVFRYPLFVEARAKIANQVLASDIWMLSKDSTQEIDIIEAYGSDRSGQEHFAKRLHLSHHVFIREPFQDYQPTDDGSWFHNGTTWRDEFHRIGVHWRDPWHLDYFVDGKLVRRTSGKDMIDPTGFTEGKGLHKPMHLIINMEDQAWRSDNGITPTDEELRDASKNIMWVDWVRVYQATQDN